LKQVYTMMDGQKSIKSNPVVSDCGVQMI